MSVRVRMAPSPTGFLHVGGVRTFLFNWLFARQQGGECRLRIENTDTSREVAEATEQIQDRCAGSGSTGTARSPSSSTAWTRSRTYAERLVEEGKAYVDDGAIRFRQPEGTVGWDDAVRGRIEFENENLADLVIVRSDGRATYNFASPVEDMLDGITHVIRGNDHVSNTPSQINILNALGADAARLRARPGRARERREEAVEEARRGLDRRLPRGGLHPRGDDELPRAARLELRRPHDRDEPGRARRALLARPRRPEPCDVRLREARLAERRPPARALRGRVRGEAPDVAARAGDRLARGAGAGDRPARADQAGEAVARTPITSASCSSR